MLIFVSITLNGIAKRYNKMNKLIHVVKRKIYELIYNFLNKEVVYSDVENKHKVIFVHIPKTGGNAIVESLFGVSPKGHKRLEKYYQANRGKFREYYKFTVVRNPYDRFESAFYYLKKGGISIYDRRVFIDYLKDINDINDFVTKLVNSPALYNTVFNYIHFKPQYYFLDGEIREKSMDYIGKIETLTKDYEIIARELGKTCSNLKKRNVNKSKSQVEMTQRTKDFIYDNYKKDFIVFGYEK